MSYYKIYILFLITSLLVISCGNENDKVAYWSFDETDSLFVEEEFSGIKSDILSSSSYPEFDEGVEGTGLRLDSYSTFIKDELPEISQGSFSVEGWFALESFPLDTAGFVSITNPETKEGLVMGITNFGHPALGWGKPGDVEYEIRSEPVEKFEWVHMAYTQKNDEGTLYLNGEIVIENVAVSKDFTPKNFIFANHFAPHETERIGYFTILNGIIDEISIYSKSLDEQTIALIYENNLPDESPDLSIPDIRFADDYLRPKYHLQPAANWTNETHGLIYYNGRYHIFNQKNASGLTLRQMNWGHFSSEDLVTWVEQRPVLSPEPGYDQNGVWSGHAVISDDGVPVIFYSSGDGSSPLNVSKAYPDDDNLINWTKYENNPVIEGVPGNFTRTDMRDPYIWKEGDIWYLTIGYGIFEDDVEKGTVILYKSEDLTNWEYMHPLFVGNPELDDSGIFWEMPIFWEFKEGKYILLVNKVPQIVDGNRVPANALYWVGSFENQKFVPEFEIPKKLEIINKFLSPSIAKDANGRTFTIGIIPVYGHGKSTYDRGWTHMFSIPRQWELKDNIIHQTPHPNLTKLRQIEHRQEGIKVSPDGSNFLDVSGHQLEIIANIKPQDSKQFGFVIAKNPDGSEKTRIYYDFDLKQFVVDATQSSKYVSQRQTKPFQIRDYSQYGDYSLDNNQSVKIHIFIDGAVIEVFVNDRDAFTATILPSDRESKIVDLFTTGGTALVEKIQIFELKSSGNTVDW